MKLFSDDNAEGLMLRLNSIIEIENKDDFKTHFRQTILFKDESKLSGTVENNQFKIWTHEQGRSGATGIFYPIVTGQFKPLSHGLEIKLNSKMNVIGKIVCILIGIMLAYVITSDFIIQENNDMKYLIRRILAGTVLFGLMFSVPSVIYFRTSKIIKQYLIKELELRNTR